MRKASGFRSFATVIATRPRESPPAALRTAAAPNSLIGPGTALVTSVAAAAVSASSNNMLPAAGKSPIAMISHDTLCPAKGPVGATNCGADPLVRRGPLWGAPSSALARRHDPDSIAISQINAATGLERLPGERQRRYRPVSRAPYSR